MVVQLLVGGHLLGGLVFAALVHQDASLRGSDHPLALAAAVMVLGVVGAAGYYVGRTRIGPLPPDAGRTRAPVGVRARDLIQGLLLIVVAFLAAAAVAGPGADAVAALGVVAPGSLEYQVAVNVFQFVGFGVAVAGYLALARDWDLVDLDVPTLPHVGLMVIGVSVLLFAQFVVAWVLTNLGVQVAQNQVVITGRRNPRYFLYMIPIAVLLVGPFEELVFRGGVQGILRRSWGSSVAVVLTSVLFGVVHLFAVIGNSAAALRYVVVAAVLGLVLGYLYERSRNLVVPAVVHGLYNAVLFGLQYASATGLA